MLSQSVPHQIGSVRRTVWVALAAAIIAAFATLMCGASFLSAIQTRLRRR